MKRRQFRPSGHRRGQALFEFVAAAIAITVVLIGFLQVTVLSKHSIENLMDARGDADDIVVKGYGSQGGDEYIKDWTAGRDGLFFTRDDQKTGSGVQDLIEIYDNELQQPFQLTDGFNNLGISNRDQFTNALNLGSLVELAELCVGEKSRTVPIEPALQKLSLGAVTSIEIRERVFMPVLSLAYDDGDDDDE